MLRLVLLIYISFIFIGCHLVDNTVNGDYGSTPPVPIGLKLNLNNCSDSPPEALPYSCGLTPEIIYEESGTIASKQLSLNSSVNFELVSNTCGGLSIDEAGRLEGELSKAVTETCSYTVRGTTDGFTVEETLTLTVSPSLSFNQENIAIQEGQGVTSVDLILSAPAPFDTYVTFDIYGDNIEVLSGISFVTKKINILKGQDHVTIDLSVQSGINNVVHQQLRLKSGSANDLPGVSISSYENTVTLRSFES